MREIPIGIQSFDDIINNNLVYVDKTALVYKLVKSHTPFFLTRPRRFGKSLLVSTLDAYFSGKRELFKGLAIDKLEQDWQTYPVIRIDLSGTDYMTKKDIRIALSDRLKTYETAYKVGELAPSVALRFNNLIRIASETTGKKVVVLVDEYDKPLLESLDNIKLNDFYRNILRAFYGVLKGAGEYLRFVLLTGVTKFSQVSVFSDLNNLRDISMLDDYAAICGVTQTELEDNFVPEINALANKDGVTYEDTLARLKKLYDGYHFSKQSPDVYNPFSVLSALANCEFDMYWFQTGTPTFLIKLIEQSSFDVLRFQNGIKIRANTINDFRVGQTNPVPVLYQSGYLTIKGFGDMGKTLTLGFPNEEVECGFLESLLPLFVGNTNENGDFDAFMFKDDLDEQNTESFLTRLKSLYASVPYAQNKQDEHYYQSLFYIIFKLMGQFIKVEEHSYKGRSDAVVQTKDAIYIFEFKLASESLNASADDATNKSEGTPSQTINKLLAEAMSQIEESGYADSYAASNKQIYKIAIVFSTQERNIVGWQIELV